MKIIQKTHDISEYLKSDEIIDYDDKSVSRLADTLYERSEDSLDYIRNVYEYVRDRIPHSADINAEGVSCSASEVLKIGHGICFAKSHLLAALLRYKGIPTGFCYQKLILDDETAPELIIHGLNGVYLEDKKIWIRLDARGNKEGVNAGFSVTEEQLAFPVRPEKGEKDGSMVYAKPAPDVLMALQSHNSRSELWADLPAELPDDVVIEYRFAAVADIDALIQIRLEMLRGVNNLGDDYAFGEDFVQASREYFRKGDQITVLALKDNIVIGCGSVCFMELMPTFSHPTGKRAHLMNIYTSGSYRRHGIAYKMISMLIEEAWNRGVTEISLDATESGRPLYRKCGFRDSDECMVLVKKN